MFSKNLYLKKMAILLKIFKIFWEKVDFFPRDFDIFMAASKFHADEISFFSFYLFLIKSYSVFCQKVAKVEHTICCCN